MIQLIASALATITAAVAASKLGSAGTIWGAAVTSVLTTGGAAVYKLSLERGRDRVKSIPGLPQNGPAATRVDLPAAVAAPWHRRWLLYAATAVAVFAVVMGGVVAAEKIMGNSLSGVVNNEQADHGTFGTSVERTTTPIVTPSITTPSETPSQTVTRSPEATPSESVTQTPTFTPDTPAPAITPTPPPQTPTEQPFSSQTPDAGTG